MKKSVLSVLITILVFFGSSFAQAKFKRVGFKVVRVGFLVQVSEGIYEYRARLEGTCVAGSSNQCIFIIEPNNKVPNEKITFNISEIPEYPEIKSLGDRYGIYID